MKLKRIIKQLIIGCVVGVMVTFILKENWKEAYKDARDVASAETGLSLSTFPEEPPFTFEESLDEKYLP